MSAIGATRRALTLPVAGLVLFALVGAFGFVACSSGDSSAKAATQPSNAAASTEVQATLDFDPPVFKPAAATVADGSLVAVRIIGGGCDLTLDGKSADKLLLPGDNYKFNVSGKGDHKVGCKGLDAAVATITIK